MEQVAVEIDAERMDAEEPDQRFYARFGSFILCEGEDDLPAEELHASLVSALRDDNRVTKVSPGNPSFDWTKKDTMYPNLSRPDNEGLLSGSSHFHSVRFSAAIIFEVHVPAKNQPTIHGKVPKVETYFAAWDGYTAVVMWETDGSNAPPSPAAGQVVIDILEDACKNAGQSLYVQACSPACKHLFAHRGFEVNFHESAEDRQASFTVSGPRDIQLTVTSDAGGGLRLVRIVHNEIKMPAGEFAELKNTARRILQLEQAARTMSLELISHDYETLKRAKEGVFRRAGYFFGDLWSSVRGRSRMKAERLLIASLWLAMAHIETLQQAFRDVSRRFDDSLTTYAWAVPELFSTDLKSDEAEVANLDPQFARAAINHKATRMDNRLVVWATVGGAAVGAAIAAAAGGLLT